MPELDIPAPDMAQPKKPEPQISAILNNCSLHALTPEIKAEVLKFAAVEATDAPFDNGHNDHYRTLKNDFAAFYGFDPSVFNWTQFAGILTRHNAFDTQILMGPVLRIFSTHAMQADPEFFITALGNDLSVEQYFANTSEIDPSTGRYGSISPDHLFKYVCNDLGLNLTYHREETPSRTALADHPVATVNIYHQGNIQGAQSGGHWERANKEIDRVHYEAQRDTQLVPLLAFLGREGPALNPYGFELLKKHIQLSNRSIVERDPLTHEFADHEATIAQIGRYIDNSRIVSKALAIKLLGNGLTEMTKNLVTRILLNAGWITPAPDGKASHKPRIRGVGTPRLYVFTDKIWGDE